MKVFKYAINLGCSAVMLPIGAKIRAVGLDPGMQLCIWAEVNPSKRESPWYLTTIGTGDDVPDGEYIGTTRAGSCIWHTYASQRV